jgi:hypothetical protein
MENATMTHGQRLEGYRAYGRAADAFEAVAWKAPSAQRFENRVANDEAPLEMPGLGEVLRATPRWVVVVGGGVVAAMTGALLGGMLQV